MISHARLLELLHYSPTTGTFTWRVSRGNQVRRGDRAGCLHEGYWQIKIDGTLYYSHKLAWFYVHGVWPEEEIDHKNGTPPQNPIRNLRPASRCQNMWNRKMPCSNTSGFKGVSFYRRNGKYRAQIMQFGKKKHLGYFDTPEQASAVYVAAAEARFGEFARVA